MQLAAGKRGRADIQSLRGGIHDGENLAFRSGLSDFVARLAGGGGLDGQIETDSRSRGYVDGREQADIDLPSGAELRLCDDLPGGCGLLGLV